MRINRRSIYLGHGPFIFTFINGRIDGVISIDLKEYY